MSKPSKLYDRAEEADLLEQAYQHRTFTLISGEPGVGKTCLAHTLREIVVDRDGGFFCRGKFDAFQSRSPYVAFASAFAELVQQVRARGMVDAVRQRIRDRVRAEGKFLTDMIPALAPLVDATHQQHTRVLVGSKFMARFVFVFRAFLQAVATPEHPLVIVLDDLQWADPCSLELLALLIRKNECPSSCVSVVATCHDTVGPDSLLSAKLREMEDAQTLICHIKVKNLPLAAITVLLEDTITLTNPQDASALAAYIYSLTEGNIFYSLELLRYLQKGGFLAKQDDKEKSWEWNENTSLSNNLILKDLVKESLLELSPPVQEMLKVASFLGGTLDEKLLSHAVPGPIHDYLVEAKNNNVVVFERNAYRWTHDEMEKAAHSLVKPEDVEKMHVTIGRQLYKSMDEDSLRANAFDVLNQLKCGASLLVSQKERYAIASLCLWAGEKAVTASTLLTALVYLDFGIELLGRDHWKDEYDLSLVLFSLTAEVLFCVGKCARADFLCQQAFEHGRHLRDLVRVHVLQVYMLGAKDKMEEAKLHALAVLQDLGVRFPKSVNKWHVAFEAFAVKRRLKGKSVDTLRRLPNMTDPDRLAAVMLLNVMFMNVYHTDPLFAPLIALRMVDLSITHGMCAASSVGFATYGLLCCSLHRDIDAGFLYGQFSLEMLDKFQCREFVPRVYAAVYGFINGWKHKYEDSLAPLQYAYQIGLESGDTEFALANAAVWSYLSFDAGKSLLYCESRISSFHKVLKSTNHKSHALYIEIILQMVRNFMGKNTRHTTELSGDAMCEESALQELRKSHNNIMEYWLHYHKANLNYVFGDFDGSAVEIRKARKVMQLPFSNVEISFILFTDGMAHLSSERYRSISSARKSLRMLKKMVKKAPQNTLVLMFLLEAELASTLPNRKETAIMNFISAIAIASDSKLPLYVGIAQERFAAFCYKLGDEQKSRTLIEEALKTYEGWGAHAKVKHVHQQYAGLIAQQEPTSQSFQQ